MATEELHNNQQKINIINTYFSLNIHNYNSDIVYKLLFNSIFNSRKHILDE